MKKRTVKKNVEAKGRGAAPEKALILRTCNSDGKSHGGFQWPKSGPVEAPDWDPKAVCGYGLHGFLWGAGDGSLADWSEDAVWVVAEVEKASVVDLQGKVKFPRAEVVFYGPRDQAVKLMQEKAPVGTPVIGGTATAGDSGTATAGYAGTATAGIRGTATAGDSGTATAGDSGTATAGYAGTATAGDSGTATAGDSGTATAGIRGTATAGYAGTATAGDSGTATAGYAGTATAGDSGTATAGDSGTATAGIRGTATAGIRGTATAGIEGTLSIRWWDGKRYRTAIFYVGEDGIEPNTPYHCENGKAVKVTP
jgi:hypothetical protein